MCMVYVYDILRWICFTEQLITAVFSSLLNMTLVYMLQTQKKNVVKLNICFHSDDAEYEI